MLAFKASSLPGNDPNLTINWTNGQGRPDLAILRMIGKQHGGMLEAHWVVQTHFDGGIQVMDPDGGSIAQVASFAAWMGTHWRSLNLDMQVWG